MTKVINMTMKKIKKYSSFNAEIRAREVCLGIYNRCYEELERNLSQEQIHTEDKGQVEQIKKDLEDLIERERMRKRVLIKRRGEVESSLKNVIDYAYGGRLRWLKKITQKFSQNSSKSQ